MVAVLAIVAMAAGAAVFVAIVWGVWRIHRMLGLHRLMPAGGFGCVLQAFGAAVLVTIAAFYARAVSLDVAGGLGGVRQHGAVLLVGLALIVLVALAVVLLVMRSRGPHGLPRRMPGALTGSPQVRWRERLFAGWGRGLLGLERTVLGTPEDSVIVVGPPGGGKTLGVLVPQMLMWGGPLVSTSTKPDVYWWTVNRRLQFAREHGGTVYVYAPTEADPIAGPVGRLQSIRWSPLDGCRDTTILTARVNALVEAAQVSKGVENADHWRSGARRVLTPLMHAAAWHPDRPHDLGLVKRWLAQQRSCLKEVLDVLAAVGGEDARDQRHAWASMEMLQNVVQTPERELGSFFSAASTALQWADNPVVMDSCSAAELDLERMLLTGSTVYVLSPTRDQETVAPLLACFVDSFVQTAYRLHAQGRLPQRLGLILDEAANIAPLPELPSIVSQARGQGVSVSVVVQNDGQLRDRWGDHAAQAIWSAVPVKIILGGLADQLSLDRISAVLGQREVKMQSVTAGIGNKTTTTSTQLVPVLTAGQIRETPPPWAVLMYRHHAPYAVRIPIAFDVPRLRRLVSQYQPSNPPPDPPPRPD
jgi:type IV secretory pathway TraG/TraD family ATPase VirD4